MKDIQKVRWKLSEVATDPHVQISYPTLRRWLSLCYWIASKKSKANIYLDKRSLVQIREVAWVYHNYGMSIDGMVKMRTLGTFDDFLKLQLYNKPNYFN